LPKEILRISNFTGGADTSNDPRAVSDNSFIKIENAAIDKVGKMSVAGSLSTTHAGNTATGHPSDTATPEGGGLHSFSTDDSGTYLEGAGYIRKRQAANTSSSAETGQMHTFEITKAVPGLTYYIIVRIGHGDAGGNYSYQRQTLRLDGTADAVNSGDGKYAQSQYRDYNNELQGNAHPTSVTEATHDYEGYTNNAFTGGFGNFWNTRHGMKVTGTSIPNNTVILSPYNTYVKLNNAATATADVTASFNPFFKYTYTAQANDTVQDIAIALRTAITTDLGSTNLVNDPISYVFAHSANHFASGHPLYGNGSVDIGVCDLLESSNGSNVWNVLSLIRYSHPTVMATGVGSSSSGGRYVGTNTSHFSKVDSTHMALDVGCYNGSDEDFTGNDWLVYAPIDGGASDGLYFWDTKNSAWKVIKGSEDINGFSYDYISEDKYTDFYMFDGALRMCSSDHNSTKQKSLWYGYIPKRTYFKIDGGSSAAMKGYKERPVGGFWWGDTQELNPPAGVFSNAAISEGKTIVCSASGSSLTFHNNANSRDQIKRTDGGSFKEDGFYVGGWIKITGAPPNDDRDINGIYYLKGVQDDELQVPGQAAFGVGHNSFDFGAATSVTGISGTRITFDRFPLYTENHYPLSYMNAADSTGFTDRLMFNAYADDTSEEGYYPEGIYEFYYSQVFWDGQESRLEPVWTGTNENHLYIGGTSTLRFCIWNQYQDMWSSGTTGSGHQNRGFRCSGERFYMKLKDDTEYHLAFEVNFEKGVRLGDLGDDWKPWGYFTPEFRRGARDTESGTINADLLNNSLSDDSVIMWPHDSNTWTEMWISRFHTTTFDSSSNTTSYGVNHVWRCPEVKGFWGDYQVSSVGSAYHATNNTYKEDDSSHYYKRDDWLELKGLSPVTYFSLNGYRGDKSISATWKCSTVLNRKVYIGNVKQDGIVYADRILKSPANKPDTFPANSFVEAAVSDGDEIVQLEGFADRILQFNKRNLHIINVAQDFEFLESTHANLGVSNPAATCTIESGVVWANKLGCYFYSGGGALTNLLERDGISVIDKEDWKSFIVSPSVGYDPRKKQIIVFDNNKDTGATNLGHAWIYDMSVGGWTYHPSFNTVSGRMTNIINDSDGTPVAIRAASNGSDTTSKIIEWKPETPTSKSIELKTKDYDFGTPSVNKKIYKMYITYKYGGVGINITYAINGSDTYSGYMKSDLSNNGTYDEHPASDTTGALITQELKPTTDINNVKSIKFRIYGTPHVDFELIDLSIVYRAKRIK